jgi:hypothetical protein
MKAAFVFGFILLSTAYGVTVDTSAADARESAPALSAKQIVEKAIDADSWGRGGIDATARVTVTEKNGQKRELAFEAESIRYAPPLSKSLLHFTAPADVSGMKFLLVQKGDGDDERTLYIPELKRSRRIAGGTRSERFMGTDFTYADMDRRDLRTGQATLEPDENIGKYACYHVSVVPRDAEALYGKVDVWVRKDNLIPLKWVMSDKSGAQVKTLLTKEIQRHEGRWQITRSQMNDRASGRTTEILIEHMQARDIPPDTFTVRSLEKS